MSARHFLDIRDHQPATLAAILADSRRMKDERKRGHRPPLLAGKALALVFERPSTRTRVSFDRAMRELGGDIVVLSDAETQRSRGETIADTAKVLSRYVDGIMIRARRHEDVLELADRASVPVINGLTNRSHPCQVMADLMTLEEHKGAVAGCKVAWAGDANNVLTSWVHAAERFGFELAVATPAELSPASDLLAEAKAAGARVYATNDAFDAVAGADCIVTDTWVSMGDSEAAWRHNILAPFRVTARLLAAAKPDAIFMHCLPAHRGDEVDAAVIDGPQSVVFDEAENRLHAQKGILAWCFAAT